MKKNDIQDTRKQDQKQKSSKEQKWVEKREAINRFVGKKQ